MRPLLFALALVSTACGYVKADLGEPCYDNSAMLCDTQRGIVYQCTAPSWAAVDCVGNCPWRETDGAQWKTCTLGSDSRVWAWDAELH